MRRFGSLLVLGLLCVVPWAQAECGVQGWVVRPPRDGWAPSTSSFASRERCLPHGHIKAVQRSGPQAANHAHVSVSALSYHSVERAFAWELDPVCR